MTRPTAAPHWREELADTVTEYTFIWVTAGYYCALFTVSALYGSGGIMGQGMWYVAYAGGGFGLIVMASHLVALGLVVGVPTAETASGPASRVGGVPTAVTYPWARPETAEETSAAPVAEPAHPFQPVTFTPPPAPTAVRQPLPAPPPTPLAGAVSEPAASETPADRVNETHARR